ncbi:hypothetical protein [Streptomyces sp. VRA16 Mangrove soil]|uniref:hypothetical protein n=1 Tax=Streptomyces sp. VRA16 Mangrove soil TaxID=2817434 RepID=UPI001E607F96|nr:hypothetical protein [Streptomyces sp. VRA16 Mangrove soil]
MSPRIRPRSAAELRRGRRSHSCWDHLYAAPLWPLHGANLGTLARTCDAVGACLTVPRFPWVPEAVARGNTLRRPLCTHWTGDPLRRLTEQRERGARIVGVELADEAVRLADLPAARERTVVVLGHEQTAAPRQRPAGSPGPPRRVRGDPDGRPRRRPEHRRRGLLGALQARRPALKPRKPMKPTEAD